MNWFSMYGLPLALAIFTPLYSAYGLVHAVALGVRLSPGRVAAHALTGLAAALFFWTFAMLIPSLLGWWS